MFANNMKLLCSYLLGQPVRNSFPRSIGIEITNRCNLDCVMCPRRQMKRLVGDMSFTLFKKIIDEIKGKIKFIWLQNYGEPFLHPDIFHMIQYAKESGLMVGVSTNATLIKSNVAKEIFNSKLDYIIFAVDGATKETYEKIRKGADYDEVVGNIRVFLGEKRKKRSPIFVVMQCIYMKDTAGEVKDFIKMWDVEGINGIRIRQITHTGQGHYKNFLKKPCYWLWYSGHINWDGTVIPCCQDVNAIYPLGNILSDSLCKLWNSDEMNDLRQAHIKGAFKTISLCANCNMYQPSNILVFGSSFFSISLLNHLIPIVESYISKTRYRLIPDKCNRV